MRGARPGDSSFESRGLCNRPFGHVPAVRPAADSQLFGIGDAPRDEVVDTGHDVPVIAATPVAAIHLNEFFAVTARSANVGIKDRVPARRKELPPCFDGVLPGARGAAVDHSDERQFRFAVVARRFQKSRFDFQAVEGFVLVELRRAERVLLPGIIQVRNLPWCALLIPKPQFLGSRRGLSRKSDLTGIGHAEGIWIGRYRRDILERAFRSESDKLRAEAIAYDGEQPAVLGPAVVKDGPVNAGAGEILSGLVAVMSEH